MIYKLFICLFFSIHFSWLYFWSSWKKFHTPWTYLRGRPFASYHECWRLRFLKSRFRILLAETVLCWLFSCNLVWTFLGESLRCWTFLSRIRCVATWSCRVWIWSSSWYRFSFAPLFLQCATFRVCVCVVEIVFFLILSFWKAWVTILVQVFSFWFNRVFPATIFCFWTVANCWFPQGTFCIWGCCKFWRISSVFNVFFFRLWLMSVKCDGFRKGFWNIIVWSVASLT